MQPILIDDVVSSLAAALDRSEAESKTIVLAGPRAMWLSDVVRICARLLERRVTVLPIPLWIARGLAGLARFFPGFPHVSDGEILRLCEDKAFSVEPMRSCLGVTPMPFEEGLKLILDQSATKKR